MMVEPRKQVKRPRRESQKLHRFRIAQRNAPAVCKVYFEHLGTSLNIFEHL